MIKEVNLKTWCTAGANPWNVSKLQLILENIWRDRSASTDYWTPGSYERYYIENILYINSKNQTCIWVVRKRLGGPLVPPFHHSLWAMRDAAACKAAYCLVSGVYTLYTPLSLSKSRLTADHYSCRGPSHQPDSTYHKLGSAPCLGLAISAWKSSIRRFVITEKAPTSAFFWLKTPTSAFTLKTLMLNKRWPHSK